MNPIIRLGTRRSALARWQTEHVAALLCQNWPELSSTIVVLATSGDQNRHQSLSAIGGSGLFTDELENALRRREIDLAVHSLKDLPVVDAKGLTLGAIPARENPADVLVSRYRYRLDTLPVGASVGTSSPRRAAQLWSRRPDLNILNIRGNVDTRIRKALDPAGPYDAIVLAYAGLKRLGRLDQISDVLPLDAFLPAPGQAALAVQCCHEPDLLALLQAIDHLETRLAVTAERAFLSGLGGGCAMPVAAYATVSSSGLQLHGQVTARDGSQQIDVTRCLELPAGEELAVAVRLGEELAREAIHQGARSLMERGSGDV